MAANFASATDRGKFSTPGTSPTWCCLTPAAPNCRAPVRRLIPAASAPRLRHGSFAMLFDEN